MKYLNSLVNQFSMIQITDVIDILVISFIIYKIIVLVKETRAEQLLKGFVVLLIFARLASLLNLYAVNWLISNLFTVGFVLIIVVFQPELRRAFERIGRSNKTLRSFFRNNREKQENTSAREIASAVASLSRQKIGALIVMENQTGLGEIIETGTLIDGVVSSELLINIFIPNTPLHDGAVIINEDKIRAAGCFLPLTSDNSLSKELGTRHRAGIGISERSDALVIIVSEETGTVSIARNGEISRRIDDEALKKILNDYYEQNAMRGVFGAREDQDEVEK